MCHELPSLKGSQVWAPVLHVACAEVIVGFTRILNFRPILGGHGIYFGASPGEAKGKGWEKGKAKAQNGERPQGWDRDE